jgi:ubiquinone/menaquinone biosynthesis C-methylase UbiE
MCSIRIPERAVEEWKMDDPNALIQRLLEGSALREPVTGSIIHALELQKGSRGLDAGCGIGLEAISLARAIGADGRITGLDTAPELLAYGEAAVKQAGLSAQIRFREGDVNSLPFDDASFDWAWSADCIGYPAWDLLPVLKELMRVVRPRGSIFLLAWSSQQILPGYALLEARLNATCSAYLPFLKDKDPEQQFLRTPRWFREAGLEEIKARSFVGEVLAPLGRPKRAALVSLFEMLWGQPQPGVASTDWKEYQRLCVPGSPGFILDQPGYYAFFTYTLFQGKVPAGGL